MGGSFRLGIAFPKPPRRGFGGSIFGAIPPLANGIEEGPIFCLGFLSAIGVGGWLRRVGILLALLGLFSERSLSAKVPCFSPFASFFTAYSALIWRPEKNWPFIWEMARSEELKLS